MGESCACRVLGVSLPGFPPRGGGAAFCDFLTFDNFLITFEKKRTKNQKVMKKLRKVTKYIISSNNWYGLLIRPYHYHYKSLTNGLAMTYRRLLT